MEKSGNLPRILFVVFFAGGMLLYKILVNFLGLEIGSFWALAILLSICLIPACICIDIIVNRNKLGYWTIWATLGILADWCIGSLIEFKHAKGQWLNISSSSGIVRSAIFLICVALSYLLMRLILILMAYWTRAHERG